MSNREKKFSLPSATKIFVSSPEQPLPKPQEKEEKLKLPYTKREYLGNTSRKKYNDRNSFAFSGLTIGLCKPERRCFSTKVPETSPIQYSYYFSDIYFNSETISFPQTQKHINFQDLQEKTEFSLPVKVNFRRLRHKSHRENKVKIDDISSIFNNNPHYDLNSPANNRSVGKAYNNLKRNNKKITPITKLKLNFLNQENFSLNIRGILKKK